MFWSWVLYEINSKLVSGENNESFGNVSLKGLRRSSLQAVVFLGYVPHHYKTSQPRRQRFYRRRCEILKSLHPEDGGSKILRNVNILQRYLNPEDRDLNVHRCENLKISHMNFLSQGSVHFWYNKYHQDV